MMFSIILDQSVKTKDNVPIVIDTIVYAIIGNFAANEIQSSVNYPSHAVQ